MTKNRQLLVLLIAIFFAALFFTVLRTPIVMAQPSPGTPLPLIAPLPSATHPFEYRDSLSFDPDPYRIVFFTQEDSFSESLELMIDILQPEIAYTQEDLIGLDDEQFIEGLILDPSGYEAIDPEWTVDLIRRGTIVVMINNYFKEWAELAGSECSVEQAENDDAEQRFIDSGLSYYYMNMTLALADNPSQQDLVEESIFEQCRRARNVPHHAVIRASHGFLETEEDVLRFSDDLMSHVNSIYTTYDSFANRDLPPTAVPETPIPGNE